MNHMNERAIWPYGHSIHYEQVFHDHASITSYKKDNELQIGLDYLKDKDKDGRISNFNFADSTDCRNTPHHKYN